MLRPGRRGVLGGLVLAFGALVARRGGPAQAAEAPLWQPTEATPRAFMQRAIDLARRGVARGDGTPYGAVVVKDGRIVGEGWNRSTVKRDPTAHAEVEAIQDACRRLGVRSLAGYTMYTNGGRPCPMCETAAYWAGLDRLYYGTSAARITDGGKPGYPRC